MAELTAMALKTMVINTAIAPLLSNFRTCEEHHPQPDGMAP